MEAKEKLQLEVITALNGLLPDEYIRTVKNALEAKMYNY